MKKKNPNDKLKLKYIKFLEKNRDIYDMHTAIYGKTMVIYESWSLKNIKRWLIDGADKPGFRFINPEENDFIN